MKKYLVTGAAGFIGSHLCEQLVSMNKMVVGIDNFDPFYPKEIKLENIKAIRKDSNFKFIEADIRNTRHIEEIFKNDQFDLVIHLAAKAGVQPSLNHPEDCIETNIGGTLNILNQIVKQPSKKLVFASSSSVYGNNNKLPFNENDLVDHPISPYAFTKKSCELLNYTFHHLYGVDIINLRLFTVIGPRLRPDLVIHKFISKILNDEPIQKYGEGDTSRDYAYIGDVVSGFTAAIEHLDKNNKVHETINLGNNLPVKLNDLIHTIYSALGKEPNILELPKQPGDVNITNADISKASLLLNYSPKTTIKEAVRKTIDWYVQR